MAKSKKSSKSAKKRARSSSAMPRERPRMVTPYLAVGDAAQAIEWYKRAFGAKEVNRQLEPTGKVMHASLKIGDSLVMLSDIFPGSEMRDPRAVGPSVNLHIYSKQIDKIFKSATAAGAKVTMPLEDQFWGDRYGKLEDPFGHHWSVATHVRDVTADEMQKAMREMKPMQKAGA